MELSVVILNYNVSAYLQLCLESVEEALQTIQSEIIVVDNNSQDDSCAMIKANFPEVKLIINDQNYGFAKGNNIGVKAATGNFVCILNPDTVISETTFSSLLAFAGNTSNFGAIGCRLIDGRGHFLPESKRRIPTPLVALKKLIGNAQDYYHTNMGMDSVGKTEILVGAFMLMKRSIYQEMAGFDEDYFMYGEDIDLSYRLLKSGLDNYYYGKETVIHFKGESTLKDLHYAKRFYGAMEIFYKKHFKKNRAFNILVKLGIQLAFKLRSSSKPEFVKSQRTYYLGNNYSPDLETVLSKPIKIISPSETIAANSLVICDTRSYGYDEIIKFMMYHTKLNNIRYRIQVKNTNFIIGSDSSLHQGDIQYF